MSGGWPTVPFTFLGLDPAEHSLERSGWAALPVPYEATTSYGKGTQGGPAAIIRASAEMEDYDAELGFEPCSWGIYTAPSLEPALGGAGEMAERVERAVGAYMDAGMRVATLGGEHSISPGAVAAAAARHPGLSVLAFDAQADLREEYQGSRYSHACAMRRALEYAPATIVGVRSMTADEAAFAREQGVGLFPRGAEPIVDVDGIVESLGGDVYVSFDLDAFDPSFMPAVGTPEPGGLGWWEALRILRAVGERRRIVGFDVVELSPGEGPESCAYTAAKLAYKLIGYAGA